MVNILIKFQGSLDQSILPHKSYCCKKKKTLICRILHPAISPLPPTPPINFPKICAKLLSACHICHTALALFCTSISSFALNTSHTLNQVFFTLLAPQSGALRISAYRDFQPNPIPSTYSFRAFRPFYSDLRQCM